MPDEVFSQLDNMIAFLFKNENEIKMLARTGKLDSKKTLEGLKNLQPRHCIAVGAITEEFPIFAEIKSEEGRIVMGGDTRRLL